MRKGLFLGEFEQLVLLALIRVKHNAYGLKIRDVIEERSKRDVSFGAVYAALNRMERKGFVTAYLADPTEERSGRAKRFFKITGLGEAALNRSRQVNDSMWEGVDYPRPSEV